MAILRSADENPDFLNNGSSIQHWADWRTKALAALPLKMVYGPYLTGNKSGDGWLECRDPSSPSGDRKPSAGVADGTGKAARGTFSSFISGTAVSVFDFMVACGLAKDFKEAADKVAQYSGVKMPVKGAEAGTSPQGKEKQPAGAASSTSNTRTPLPTIITGKRFMRNVAADAWAAIHKFNKPPVLFNRLGELVWVQEQEIEGKKIRGVAPVGDAELCHRLAHIANWMKQTKKGTEPTYPDRDVLNIMRSVVDRSLPSLLSMVEGPVFDRAGKLICTPGYHPQEALWMHLQDDFAIDPIPTSPTPDDVAWANDLIFNELLVDFPFVDQPDRAHAAAALLLPFIRRMIPGRTPIHLVEAPTAGSGKGFICQAVSILATGSEMIAATIPNDDDEIRKRLTAELTLARPIIVLDNADERQPLHSPSLASVLTAETWTDRVLGKTNMVTCVRERDCSSGFAGIRPLGPRKSVSGIHFSSIGIGFSSASRSSGRARIRTTRGTDTLLLI